MEGFLSNRGRINGFNLNSAYASLLASLSQTDFGIGKIIKTSGLVQLSIVVHDLHFPHGLPSDLLGHFRNLTH